MSGKVQKTNDRDVQWGMERIFSKYWYVVLFFALMAAFGIYCSVYKSMMTWHVQVFFAVVAAIVCGISVYLLVKKRINLGTLATMPIVLGIALRLCYMLYTNYNTRQHDVAGAYGHMNYILYVAKNFTLWGTGEGQAYHPPIHYMISGAAYDLGKLVGLDNFLSISLVQLVMVFFSSISLVFVYKILCEAGCGNIVKFTGVSFFAFHPTNIYFSAFLNNDNTMFMFYIISFYFLVRWVNSKSMKDIILLSIFISIGALVKKTPIILIPIVLLVFAVGFMKDMKNVKKDIKGLKPYLTQAITFIAVTIPLSASYQIRNYILFNQGLGYTVQPFFKPFPNSLYNLFFVPFERLFSEPFTVFPNYNFELGDKNEFYAEYLLKSSLFGEWQFPGLESIARVLVLLAVAIVLICVAYLIMQKKNDMGGLGYIFLSNLVISLAFAFQARLMYPFVCAQNFRYASPILISAVYFLGKAAERFFGEKHFLIKYLVPVCTVLFCIVSALFILQIGFPDASQREWGYTAQ